MKKNMEKKLSIISNLFMLMILSFNTICNTFIPITSYAAENITHNVWVDLSKNGEIMLKPISGGEIINGFCVDLDKVISNAYNEKQGLKYEELESDNPEALFNLIVLSQAKLDRLPYKTAQEIFNYIKGVYYYGITEGYTYKQIQDAVWEFTNGLYSNTSFYFHKDKSAEGKILYQKAVNQPLKEEQLSRVHIRTFKYIRGGTTPTQNVINIEIDEVIEKEVQVSKVNLGGEEIAGANIQIKQGDKVVTEWISEKDKTHSVNLLPGEYIFHEKVAPKGYVAVTDITFTVSEEGTVEVTNINGNIVTAEGNKLTVTDQAEYVNPVGTLKTTVTANEKASTSEKAVEVSGDQLKAGVTVTDTITYEGLVANKVYSVTGELYEVKDGKVVGTAKATQTKEFTVSENGNGEWVLDFGKVAGLEANKTYVVYETAISKENLVDKNKDNTPEEKHVVDHKDPNDKAQTVVTTPEVPKEKEVQVSKVNLGGEEIAGANIQIKQGDKVVTEWISEKDKTHSVNLLPGEYIFHEKVAPKGYVAVTDITFTVSEEGTVEVTNINGNIVTAEGNKLTVTDQAEYVNPVGTLKTTVTANEKASTSEKAVEVSGDQLKAGVTVTDTITYEGLVANKVYSVTGELYEVKDGKVVGTAKATQTKEFTVSENGNGEWVLDFGKVAGLEANKTYVVYETAISKENLVDKNKDNTPEEKHVVDHKDPNDKAQTVVTTPEVPKEKEVQVSKVNLGGEEIAGANIQIKQGDKVVTEWISEKDKTHSVNLLPGEYIFHEKVAPKGYVAVTDITFTVSEEGTVEVTNINGNIVTAEGNKLTVTDQAEYVNPVGTLKTTVTANEKASTSEKAVEVSGDQLKAGVTVTDTITYEGLVANKVYSVTGELYEVKDGKVVGTAKATQTKEFTVSENGNGEWVLDFGKVAGLEANKTYVVYETAISKENLVDKNKDNTPEEKHVVDHKDPNDKAQTVVTTPEVPKEKEVQVSKVNLGGEEIAGANIQIKQGDKVVTEWISEKDKTHSVNLLPGEYIFHEKVAPKGYVAVTDITFTVSEEGTVEVTNINGNIVTAEGNKLTVTDQAEYVNPVGTLKTTVTANEKASTSEKAVEVSGDQLKAGVTVTDTITYEGLVANKVYSVTGELYEVKDGKVVGTAKATQTKEFTVSENGNGEWVLDFGKVAGLEANKTYVVYETAISKENLVDKNKDNTPEEKHVVDHKDPNDKAQTVVTTPEVPKEKEVQVSKVNLGGEEIAGANIQIKQGDKVVTEWISEKDKTHSVNLLPGEYIFHEKVAPKGYVAVTDITFTVSEEGTVEVTNINGNIVTAEGNKLTVTDQAEYVNPVGTLKTTVTANEKASTSEKAVEVSGDQLKAGVTVTDTITYEGLVANKVYSVTGELYEVKDGKVVGTAKATQTKEFTVSENGNGEWVLDFGKVAGLEANKTYVVYETAISKENLVDKNKDNTPEEKHVVDHKDPNDKAQTVVTTPEVPKEKEVQVSKVNLGGEEIAGANIQIKQGDKVVTEWISEKDKTHSVNLLPGEYIFHEKVAPKGYVAVTDITFTVSEEGTVEVTNINGNIVTAEGNKLTVTDQAEYVNPVGTLKTTVTANEKASTSEKAVEVSGDQLKAGVTVTDTITYEGLVANKVYSVTGELYEVKDGKVVGTAKATQTKEFTVSENGNGEWVLDFGKVAGLEANKTYVVYETAISKENLVDKNKDNTPEEKHVVDHKDPNDKAQTVVTTPEVPKEKEVQVSKVNLGGEEIAGANIQIKQGDKVVTEWISEKDKTHSVNLLPGEYIFHEKVAPKGYVAVTDITFTVSEEGTVEVTNINGNIVTAEGNKLTVTDQAEYVNPVGTLKTTVTANEKASTSEKAVEVSGDQLKAGVTVTDTITYEGLVANKVYSVTGELYEVKDGKVVGTAKATQTKEFTVSENGNGEWVLDFGKVAGLEANKTYVVYETAISKENLVDKNKDNTPEEKHVVDHKDPNDKAQTVVTTPEVPKEKEVQVSKVNLGGEEIAGANIQIKQGDKVVTEWISEKDKTHSVNLLPGEYIFHEKVAPKGYVAVTDITFTVSEEGTVEVTNINGNIVTAEGNKLTVTDQAEYVNPVGTLKTTVTANEKASTSEKAVEVSGDQLKAGVTVTDTITYEGLVANKVYSVTGELYEVKDGKVVGTAKATQTKEFTVSENGNGEWVLDFGKVAGLEANKTYVVYETAISKENLVDKNKDNTPEEKHVVDHKDPNDKAQTVVTTPEVPKEKEVQVSKVNLGGEEIAGANIQIKQGDKVVTEWISEKDKTHSVNLLPGEYIFHEKVAPKGYVAVTDITFTVSEEGTVEVTNINGNIVTAEGNKLTVTDQAEYVNPVGTLKTTVTANEKASTSEKAVEVSGDQLKAGVTVTDTITYEGLVANKVYSVTGELYEVKDGKVVGTAKATQTKEFTVSENGNGEWVLDFGKVAGLEANKTYVVYETAISKENLVDKNKDNTPEEKHVVDHKDPNDKAQTVVTTPEEVFNKNITPKKNGGKYNSISSDRYFPKTGESHSYILSALGSMLLMLILSVTLYMQYIKNKHGM